MTGKFALDVGKFALDANEALETVVKRVEIEIFSRILFRSPVDTGRFRGNWFVDQRKVTNDVDKSGEITVARMTEAVNASQVGGVTSYINSLPYSERLEFGYSQKAPEGVVRITVAEFGAIVEEEAAKERI